MEKQLEYFDVLANAQKQVLNNTLELQTEMRTQWIDAVSKSYAAITSIPGVPENAVTKEALTQFNNWFGTVANASKTATAEALKAQENLIGAYDKQVAINRDALKNVIELVTPILAKAKLA
jgi:hypothetical protein